MKSFLRIEREKRTFSQFDVAAKLGVSLSFVSQVERLKQKPSVKQSELMEDFYGVSIIEFWNKLECHLDETAHTWIKAYLYNGPSVIRRFEEREG